ncbi:hypothetical protein NL676_031654 [Syzygium grande]|nr:hypothetical protein NL676_031654 [Syzygium grande]
MVSVLLRVIRSNRRRGIRFRITTSATLTGGGSRLTVRMGGGAREGAEEATTWQVGIGWGKKKIGANRESRESALRGSTGCSRLPPGWENGGAGVPETLKSRAYWRWGLAREKGEWLGPRLPEAEKYEV